MKWLLLAALPLWSAITSITWPTAPTTVEASGAIFPAKIAADSSDNAVVVWRNFSAPVSIKAAYRPNGGDWNTSVAISTGGETSLFPQVGMDGSGNALALWINSTAGFVQSADRPAGNTDNWGAAENLADSEPEGAFPPSLRLNANGDAIAAWIRTDDEVGIAYRPGGGSWTVYHTITGNNNRAPSVSIDSDGNALVVWANNSGNSIQQVYFTAGTPGGIATISGVGDTVTTPQVAMDTSGNATAVWLNSTENRIEAAYRPNGGSWGTPVTISGSGDTLTTPQVSMDPLGNAVAVWDNNTDNSIESAYRPAGSVDNWSSVTVISGVGTTVTNPQIATDSEGNAFAAWYQLALGNGTVQTAYRSVTTGEWNTPIDLNPSGSSWFLGNLTANPTGNIYTAMTGGDSGTAVGVSIGQVTRTPAVTTRTVFWGSRKIEVQVR